MGLFASKKIILLALSAFLLFGCLTDNDKNSKKRNDCSVIARCEGQAELEIRLRQVETYYFENTEDIESRAADLAQFDYNEQNQWIGGVTRRVAESNFDYRIEYDADGKMSQSTRTYYDDLGNVAELSLEYFYNSSVLDKSVSHTDIRNSEETLLKTIDEEINYSYINGKVADIHFDVVQSQGGSINTHDFHYEMIYENELVSEIHITKHSNEQGDYLFKSYNYDEQGRVSQSVTKRLKSSNEPEEHETITYEYYIDGPLKVKTSIVNTTPQQKIVTRYLWESGQCATNQTFGDRLFPTPEVPLFPCYQP